MFALPARPPRRRRPRTTPRPAAGHAYMAGASVVDWRPMRRGRLLGFVTIRLPAVALAFVGCPLFSRTDGSIAVTLPARPLLDNGGRQRRDPDTGHVVFEATARWTSKAAAAAFTAVVVELIAERFPEALQTLSPPTPRLPPHVKRHGAVGRQLDLFGLAA